MAGEGTSNYTNAKLSNVATAAGFTSNKLASSFVDVHAVSYIYIYIYIYNVSFHSCPRLIPFCNIATSFFFIILCRLGINVIKLCKPLSQLDLPTLRKGSREERMQQNK